MREKWKMLLTGNCVLRDFGACFDKWTKRGKLRSREQ